MIAAVLEVPSTRYPEGAGAGLQRWLL